MFVTAGLPNFIIIVVDDLGYGDVGWSFDAAADIETDKMEKIVQEYGQYLRRYYVQPMCTPSRYQLLFGKHEVV